MAEQDLRKWLTDAVSEEVPDKCRSSICNAALLTDLQLTDKITGILAKVQRKTRVEIDSTEAIEYASWCTHTEFVSFLYAKVSLAEV